MTVNCGAIPENLIESILFGHEKGSFTGASDKHLGKFQEADGGTLFLDEIGELRLDMQVKLLRALQEGEVDPVGSKRPVKVDVRIIAATNRDLGAMAREGSFREDLYYRLNVFPVTVPALRDRTGDIAPLSRHFIERFAAEENKQVSGLTAAGQPVAGKVQLAGQCAPAGKHHLPRRGAVRRRDAGRLRFPADRRGHGRGNARRARTSAGQHRRWPQARAAAPLRLTRSTPRTRRPYPQVRRDGIAKSSAWPSPAMTAICRKWRGAWASAARPSIAS